jgi:hypothetical protein
VQAELPLIIFHYQNQSAVGREISVSISHEIIFAVRFDPFRFAVAIFDGNSIMVTYRSHRSLSGARGLDY